MGDSYCLISSNVQWQWPISFAAHPERIWLTVALLLRALPARRSVLDVDWNLARTSSPDSSGILECLACTPIQVPWFGPVRKNPISNAFHLICFSFVFCLPVRLAGVSHRVLILALYRKADASLKKPIVCTIPVRNNLLRPVPISILTPSKRKAISKETINCVLLSVLIWWTGPKWKTVTFVHVLLACKLSVPRLLSPIHLKRIEDI